MTGWLLKVALALGILSAHCAGTAPREMRVQADRWLEIDLYWFERTDIQGSAERFWQRFNPLFKDVKGWRGVILNVGFTADYLMDWRGDLAQALPTPDSLIQEPWFEVGGQLAGNTAERMQKAKERFAAPADFLKKDYEPWTYNDLKQLAASLRQTAKERHGLEDIRVGSLVLGWPGIYGGKSSWAARHPAAYLKGNFNPGCQMEADPDRYGGFPNGIAAGTPLYEVFGEQWGGLSKAVGLDAIVLRDSILLAVSYRRGGPFGPVAPSTEKAAAWNQAAASLVRATKRSNPHALVIGYSSGAGAIADWRANCLDLESIAKEGSLDAWIDQTWAGAWNEVGVRNGNFWNNPLLGWTYQLSFMLMHAAALANTRVQHYHLAETFDAWESWDIIHTVPERLRWGIWAYSHAAVKTPEGLKLPAGSYVSWANQGKRLLSPEDVGFLAANLNAAFKDSRQMRKVFGATLVYTREAMAWQMAHAAPGAEIKEWIDEQAGTLMKWPVPILSATRLEWMSKVQSDLFLVQTPVHLSEQHTRTLAKLIDSGQPIMLVGSVQDGIAPELRKLVGIAVTETNEVGYKTQGGLVAQLSGVTGDLPATFPIYQRWTMNRATGDAQTIYSVDGSAALVLNIAQGRMAALWDPPDFKPKSYPGKPLRELLGGSSVPYVLTAGVANLLLSRPDVLHASEIELDQTMTLGAWQLKDGSFSVLAGNLEEGLRAAADHNRHATVVLPSNWFAKNARLKLSDVWSEPRETTTRQTLSISLGQGGSRLLRRFPVRELRGE